MTQTGTIPPSSPGHRSGTEASSPREHTSFAGRVMAAVAREPRPSVLRAFVTSLLGLHLGDAGATLRTAGRLAFERARPVVPLVRLQSLVLIVLLALLLGVGGVLAAGGTVRVIEEIRRSRPDGPRPASVEASPGSSFTPEGREGVGLPSDDVGHGQGDEGSRQGDTDRRQQDATRTRSEAPQSGTESEPRRRQQGDDQQDGGQQGTAPRDGSDQQGGTRRQTPAPDGRQVQASPVPGPGSGEGRSSPRHEGRSEGGD